MPGLDPEQQFKFLLCCIKHSQSGRVDFNAVAEELEIVSKAAAAKRYERLLKAHGIASSAKNGDEKTKPKAPAGNKRKRAAAVKDEGEDDSDDEPLKKPKTEKAVKSEVKAEKKEKITKVKTEVTASSSAAAAAEDDGDEYFSD